VDVGDIMTEEEKTVLLRVTLLPLGSGGSGGGGGEGSVVKKESHDEMVVVVDDCLHLKVEGLDMIKGTPFNSPLPARQSAPPLFSMR